MEVSTPELLLAYRQAKISLHQEQHGPMKLACARAEQRLPKVDQRRLARLDVSHRQPQQADGRRPAGGIDGRRRRERPVDEPPHVSRRDLLSHIDVGEGCGRVVVDKPQSASRQRCVPGAAAQKSEIGMCTSISTPESYYKALESDLSTNRPPATQSGRYRQDTSWPRTDDGLRCLRCRPQKCRHPQPLPARGFWNNYAPRPTCSS